MTALNIGIATAQDAPSIFFDQPLPSRASVDIHDALKLGEFSAVYIRPRNFDKDPIRPVYEIEFVNDFTRCNQFDDSRTLYQDLRGYKLSAAIFDKDSTVDLFMEEPRSAAFINGECLLAKPVGTDAPQADIQITYKSKRRDYYIVSHGSKTYDPVDTLDLKLPIIRSVLDGSYTPPDEDEGAPRIKREKPVYTVSEDNIIRALTEGNETYQQVALHVLRHRLESYFSYKIDITPSSDSNALVNTLLTHPLLKDEDEVSRTAVLQALAAIAKPENSARAKAAIITAMDTEYPFTMDRADRDSGARFGLTYVADGTPRKGHQSQKIAMGTAALLQKISEADRNEILARYPESYDTLFGGTYKSLREVTQLRKLVRGK